MKQLRIWVFIGVIVSIMGYVIYKQYTSDQLAQDYRRVGSLQYKLITKLKQDLVNNQEQAKVDIQKAREESSEGDIIFGYLVGYLTTHDPKLITNELPEFADLTAQYADEFGVNPYECLSICQIENGFDLHKRGDHGEEGPAQLMASTWADYYKKFGYQPDDFYKWQCNFRVAVCHYSVLLKQHQGDTSGAIGEYNGGGKWVKILSSRNHVLKFEVANRGISLLQDRKRREI